MRNRVVDELLHAGYTNIVDADLSKYQIKLYRKAKNEPGFRFYQLYDKVYREDILLHAYALAKANEGAPGVDGESFQDIESRGRKEWLNGLRKDLHDKTYKPQPVRRKMIAKPGGGERALGIPTIRDRVAQTAAKLILEPIWEAELEPNAYGYRPRKSAQDAIQKSGPGFYPAFSGSSPITVPFLLPKPTRSKGPSLHRHYPASSVPLTLSDAQMVRRPFRRRSRVATPRPSRASPTDADYLPGMLCSLPRWSDPCCWLWV
jgi:hypothetical protein